MSGPTTAILVADPIEVLLSAAIIRAAMAVQEGYAASADLADHHRADRSKVLNQQQQAAKQQREAVAQLLQQVETEFSQLLTLSQRLNIEQRVAAGKPVHHEEESDNYLLSLQSYNSALKAILQTELAKHPEQSHWRDAIDTVPDFLSAISSANTALPPVNDPDILRLVGRIAHLGEIPLPISELLSQLAHNLPTDRNELLKQELRLQIQHHLEASSQRQVQEASALIMRQSLLDLGYQVEEFTDTLLVDGGVVHFRRHGWGDYMVRMRISPHLNEKKQTANFNVIRAVKDANNERSVLDHLAEDRWCAEFPALLKAMEARGLGLHVTRRLEAGEVPVQLVDANQLPTFEDEYRRQADQPLKARELN